MNKTVSIFIALLRSAITGTNEIIDISDLNWESLYSLARYHDLAHIIYYELKQRNALCEGEIFRKLKNQFDIATYRHIKRELAILEVRETLNGSQIPFILLKGTNIMNLYPQPWMRTSSDIDVLVKPEDHKNAIYALQKFGMVVTSETDHDVSLFTQEQYHIELHFSLIDNNDMPKTVSILDKVWQYTTGVENSFERELNDEMFYFYHLAHMAKHIKKGGCGVRYFVDLWLLNHRKEFDTKQRQMLIDSSELLTFTDQASGLSEEWFTMNSEQPYLEDFEEFVVSGGIYGSIEHSVTIRNKKSNNRLVYYLGRVFLPYKKIKYAYPILKKHPILLPFCWIVRWFKILNPKVRKKALKEIDIEKNIDKRESDRIEKLMRDLKIW